MGVYDNVRHIQQALRTSSDGLSVNEIRDWLRRHTTQDLSYNVIRENLIGMLSIGLVIRYPVQRSNGLGYCWKLNHVVKASLPSLEMLSSPKTP